MKILSLIFLLFSCMKIPTKDFDKLLYRFNDSSVPPKYHRSYTIQITDKQVQCAVDVYGKVIADTSFAPASEAWENLKKMAAKIEKAGEKINKGMAGTKIQFIGLFKENKKTYELRWDSRSEVSQDTEKFVQAIRAMVPSLKAMCNKPFEE